MRCLDIGPHKYPIKGFETLDARPGFDIQADASEPLPIPDDTYGIVHASHVIEHIAWWKTAATLKEWVRILTPGGRLEIWTINAAMIAQYILAHENGLKAPIPDGWLRRNKEQNPYKWAAGRLFSYDRYEPYSWHRALFTPKYLVQCMEEAGLSCVRIVSDEARRGHNHGACNLGVWGIKTSGSYQYKEPDVQSEPEAIAPADSCSQPSSSPLSPEEPEAWSDGPHVL